MQQADPNSPPSCTHSLGYAPAPSRCIVALRSKLLSQRHIKCYCLYIHPKPFPPARCAKISRPHQETRPKSQPSSQACLQCHIIPKLPQVEVSLRNLQSELLLVSPDLSRSRVSASACFSSSGTRRRLELMNQLLICAPVSAPWRNRRAKLLT